MTFVFPLRPHLKTMQPYVPGEQQQGQHILKLNTNESPYPPSETVWNEIEQSFHRLRVYPPPAADGLCRALAAYHGVQMEQVFVGNGSDEVLRLLFHLFMDPTGGKAAMVAPSYSLYPVLAEMFGGQIEVYPLEKQEKLPKALFGGKEELLLLPNPNPPLGTFYSRSEVAELCRSREKGLVVIDEAYVDFAPRDVMPLLHEFENLAITRTFSKSFSLAGLRVGYLVSHPDLIAHIGKIKDSYNVNAVSQVAAAAAIASVQDMLSHRDQIIATREITTKRLREMGYTVPDSQGNFVYAMHPSARKHFEQLHAEGILVRYFEGRYLKKGMRVSIGTPEQMERFFSALEKIFTE